MTKNLPTPPHKKLNFAGNVGCAWGSGNQIFFFPQEPQYQANNAYQIEDFKWEHHFGDTRILLNEWLQIFKNIQERMQEEHNHARRTKKNQNGESRNKRHTQEKSNDMTHLSLSESASLFLFRQSRRYLTELECYIRKSAKKLDDPKFIDELKELNVSPEMYEEKLKIFEQAKSAWHLCEIFLLDPFQNITNQLVGWLQFLIPYPAYYHRKILGDRLKGLKNEVTLSPRSRQELSRLEEEWEDVDQKLANESKDNDSIFWYTLEKLAIQGRHKELLELLDEDHELLKFSCTKDILVDIIKLIKTFPSRTFKNIRLIEHVVDKFRTWQKQCTKLSSQIKHKRLRGLIDLMSGKTEVLERVADTWYELLIGYLLFQNPHANKDEIPNLAYHCIKLKNIPVEGEHESLLDKFRKEIFTCNQFEETEKTVEKAINFCNQAFDTCWFVAHLTDILTHARQLGNLRLLFNGKQTALREIYLIKYAETIACAPSTWQIASEYLYWCDLHGTAYARVLLNHQTLSCDRTALKVANICRRFKLNREEQQVYKQMGMDALRRKRYASAIQWFTLAMDTNRISSTCSILLHRHFTSSTNTLTEIEAVVNNITDDSRSPELRFLGQYRDFSLLQREIRRLDRRARQIQKKKDETKEDNPETDPILDFFPDEEDDFKIDEEDDMDADSIYLEAQHLAIASVNIMVSIFTNKYSPRRWWLELLWQIVPLLARGFPSSIFVASLTNSKLNQPVLSVDDTHRLMACLEELCTCPQKEIYLEPFYTTKVNEEEVKSDMNDICMNQERKRKMISPTTKISIIRMALLRNLQFSLHYQHQLI